MNNDAVTTTEALKWQEEHKDDILSISIYQNSGGGSIFATCSYDGNIMIWSLDTGRNMFFV